MITRRSEIGEDQNPTGATPLTPPPTMLMAPMGGQVKSLIVPALVFATVGFAVWMLGSKIFGQNVRKM